MSTIGIGMIGCGLIGMDVIRRLLAQDDRLQVRAICDPDPRSVASALAELDPEPAVYADYRDLLAAADVQWVMIASWNRYHCEHAVAAFAAGKHVFCQKPLALSVDECRRIVQAHAASGAMFNIGFTLRYSPHYRKISELIASGAIGDVISMELNDTLDFNHGGFIMGDWRRLRQNAGTLLLEKCCHDIDLANWMTGSRASRVASFGGLNFFRPENTHHISRIGPDQQGRPAYMARGGLVALDPFRSHKDIVDNQVAILEYENGVRATFHTNCNAALPERRMVILGSEGAIRADVLAGVIELRRIGFDTPIEDVSTGARGSHGHGDDPQARELADSMLRGAPPVAGLPEALAATLVCFAIDEANESGQVVDVGPYWMEMQS